MELLNENVQFKDVKLMWDLENNQKQRYGFLIKQPECIISVHSVHINSPSSCSEAVLITILIFLNKHKAGSFISLAHWPLLWIIDTWTTCRLTTRSLQDKPATYRRRLELQDDQPGASEAEGSTLNELPRAHVWSSLSKRSSSNTPSFMLKLSGCGGTKLPK